MAAAGLLVTGTASLSADGGGGTRAVAIAVRRMLDPDVGGGCLWLDCSRPGHYCHRDVMKRQSLQKWHITWLLATRRYGRTVRPFVVCLTTVPNHTMRSGLPNSLDTVNSTPVSNTLLRRCQCETRPTPFKRTKHHKHLYITEHGCLVHHGAWNHEDACVRLPCMSAHRVRQFVI